jgi:ABC-type sugar transport system substrate-binding protein
VSPTRSILIAAAAVLGVLGTTACTNPEQSGSTTPGSSQGGEQVAKSTPPSGAGCTLAQYGGTKLDPKTAVVGFSQSEKEANPFRIAETASIKAEAAKQGVKLLTTNAESNLGKQVSDIQSMLAQGAQVLIVAPLNSEGLEPALKAARDRNVPVITVDRKLTSAQPCKDYVTFIGSDFVDQGKRAAQQLVKATGGNGKVAILLGSSGNNVTTDRTNGFKTQLGGTGLQVVAEQTGDFAREKGQSVTELLLQSHPEITAVYAENDEMALGAVTAIKSAGRKPGQDIKVVSVDGTRSAVEAISTGEINGVVESNPRFGPLAFATVQKFYAEQPVDATIVIQDKEYDPGNASAEVGNAY